MLEVRWFEEAFGRFINVTYHDAHDGLKWRYNSAQRQASYQALFGALRALLVAKGVAYDDFIEQELYAWATPASGGNPLALPLTAAFLRHYTNPNYKYSFLVLCLQSQAPAKDISAALIQACYAEVRRHPTACASVTNLLDFLGEYPNPAAVDLVAFLLPYLTDDWYGQDLALHLPYVLQVNPGPAATALLARWATLEAELEAARRRPPGP